MQSLFSQFYTETLVYCIVGDQISNIVVSEPRNLVDAQVHAKDVDVRNRENQGRCDKFELPHADKGELYSMGFEDEGLYAGPWCLGSH